MRRQGKIILPCVVVVAVLMGMAPSGLAQSRSKQSAEKHYNKGMTAYSLGHFRAAIEEFEKAYEIKPEPIFLYNIAQSHRQNGNPQQAVFFYRRYLDADPNAKNRPAVEKRISEMEAQLNARKDKDAAKASPIEPSPAPPVVASQPVATAAAPAPVAVTPPPVDVQEPVPPPSPEPRSGRGLRIAGIVVGSVGVAALAGGIFFYLHASSLHDQAYPPLDRGGYDAGKDDSSKTFRILGWVSLGVGAAALGTGVVLFSASYGSKNSEKTLALTPLLAPGASGASLSGRF
jgi:tetratricopeptide (TPR) repeat protein